MLRGLPSGKPFFSVTIGFMIDELQQQLDALARDDCYRVDAVLKETELERTERVFFVGANGAEQGPYVRKTFTAQAGLGNAYERILAAQRAGARFVHLPRIIDCYDAGERQVVVMEWLCGHTLGEEVHVCGPSLELACRLFPQACDAVCELHERFTPPIIHRDIKPSNFMVLGNTVMLIDLGIARTFDAAAATDTHQFGTRAYAPPEQFGYGQTDVRSDVYALGMLLFYMLCEETASPAMLEARMSALGVPSAIQDVVLRACSFDPTNRYRSVTELKQAFLAVTAPPAAAAVRAQPQPREPLRVKVDRAGQSLAEFFNRIPVGVGIAWNVVLLSYTVLLGYICVASMLNPVGDTAALPLGARVASYAATWLMFVSPVPSVVDVRSLHRILPRFASLRWLARMGVSFAVILSALVLLIAVGGVYVNS